MAASLYNYAAAFVEYCKGTPVEDIALALAIPLETLKAKIRTEAWQRLSGEMALSLVPAKRAERDLAKIEDNRTKNMQIAELLQRDAFELAGRLLKGELKMKFVTPKGDVVELEPTAKDRKNIAEYANRVAEMTYRALGDSEKPAHNADGQAAQGGPTVITINLPPQIGVPRAERLPVAADQPVLEAISVVKRVAPCTALSTLAAQATDGLKELAEIAQVTESQV
jgi:hypothetical protein